MTINDTNQLLIIRFILAVSLSIVIAFGFNWPLAFIAPVFVAKFMGNDNPDIPFKKLINIFLVMAIAFYLAILFTKWFMPFPIVFVLLLTILIYWVAYWGHSGGNEFVILMLLIGIVLMPMLSKLHTQVPIEFTMGFLFSCFIALMITFCIQSLFPNKNPLVAINQTQANLIELSKRQKFRLAALTTIIIMPAFVFFLKFDLSSEVLILAFITILAQKPDIFLNIQGSKALLVGNAIGGLVAMLLYLMLLTIPNFSWLILLSTIVVAVFAQQIFSKKPSAPLYAMALTTVIILIASSVLAESDVSDKFYIRMIQIALACFYIVSTTSLVYPFLQKIRAT